MSGLPRLLQDPWVMGIIWAAVKAKLGLLYIRAFRVSMISEKCLTHVLISWSSFNWNSADFKRALCRYNDGSLCKWKMVSFSLFCLHTLFCWQKSPKRNPGSSEGPFTKFWSNCLNCQTHISAYLERAWSRSGCHVVSCFGKTETEKDFENKTVLIKYATQRHNIYHFTLGSFYCYVDMTPSCVFHLALKIIIFWILCTTALLQLRTGWLPTSCNWTQIIGPDHIFLTVSAPQPWSNNIITNNKQSAVVFWSVGQLQSIPITVTHYSLT